MARKLISNLTVEQLDLIIQKVTAMDEELINSQELVKIQLFHTEGMAGSRRTKGLPPEFVQDVKFGPVRYPKRTLVQWLYTARAERRQRERFSKKMKKCVPALVPPPMPQAPVFESKQRSLFDAPSSSPATKMSPLSVEITLPGWVGRMMEFELGKQVPPEVKTRWLRARVVESLLKRVDGMAREETLQRIFNS